MSKLVESFDDGLDDSDFTDDHLEFVSDIDLDDETEELDFDY